MSEQKTTPGRDMEQSGGAYEMVGAGVVFALAGLWLDRQLGWTPVLTVALTIVGFVGGTLGVYYRYRRDMSHIEGQRSGAQTASGKAAPS